MKCPYCDSMNIKVFEGEKYNHETLEEEFNNAICINCFNTFLVNNDNEED